MQEPSDSLSDHQRMERKWATMTHERASEDAYLLRQTGTYSLADLAVKYKLYDERLALQMVKNGERIVKRRERLAKAREYKYRRRFGAIDDYIARCEQLWQEAQAA